MDVELLSQDKDKGKLSFVIRGINPVFANTLRRMIIEEVPTLAIEDVEIKDNNSVLYDEMIAHRLGLVPIKTDLKSYELPAECSCKGKGCAKCTLKLTLSSKSAGYVYAKDMKSKDSKCFPIYPDIPVAKLLKGQKIELVATAVLGQGKEHTKWSPGLAYYYGYPSLKLKSKEKNASVKSDIIEASNRCNKLIEEQGDSLKITDVTKWNHAYEQICGEYGIEAEHSDTDFIFNIESWGQLEPKEIVTEAVKRLQKKTDEFTKLFK